MIQPKDRKQIVSDHVCINCIGQEIDGEALNLAAKKVDHLKEYCPSDAFIELDVKRAKSLYGVHLVVRTPCSEISAGSKRHSLEEALEESLSTVHARLREWRKERFACPTNHGIGPNSKGGYL